jgi:hypothetical protein
MSAENVPLGLPSDGQALILFVPAIANPSLGATEDELTAVGVKRLTYSATGDGYKHTVTINKVRANRFTLPQEIQYDGTIVDDVAITYAYTNTTGDVIRLALPVGQTGFIVERWAIANSVDIAEGQFHDIIPIRASIPLKDAPVRNQELTRTQVLNVTGTVYRDLLVQAGA